jgi:DtxR family Mn-dependent transcriptional regulator
MQLNENVVALLERLWVATKEEARPGLIINDTTTLEGMDELVQLGLAERSNGHLTLTPAGHPEATQAVRQSRLAERLLVDVLTTQEALLDEPTCRLEHVLFDGLADKICTLLGHPRFCPHGKPIPEGECCRQKRESVDRLIAPMSELQAGRRGHVAYIQMHNPQRLQKLMAMGVLPGVPITLLRAFPSFVFEADYSQFAVDEEIAADIYVRLVHD